MSTKKTKSIIIMEIMKLILEKYPVRWNSKELSISTKAPIRTINRILSEMTQSGLLERKHSSYSLPIAIVNQLYGAKWFVRQEMGKDIIVAKEANND